MPVPWWSSDRQDAGLPRPNRVLRSGSPGTGRSCPTS
jgi:hypothetical protein